MSRSFKYIAVALGLILATSGQAQEDIHEPAPQPETADSQPTDKATRPPQGSAPSVTAPTDPSSEKHDADATTNGDGEPYQIPHIFFGDGWAQWAMVLLAFFGVLISGWAVWLLKKTLDATVNAIGEGEKATVAATSAAKYTRTANRPFLTPAKYRFDKFSDVDDKPKPPIVWAFNMDIMNIGGGPAFIESYGVTHVIKPSEITGDVDIKDVPINGRMFVRPDAERNFGVPFHYYTADNPGTWEKIKSCAINLYVVGYIQYTDSFGVKWKSGFCFVFIPSGDSSANLAVCGPNSLWYDREVKPDDKSKN